jgi:hypothetical protein
MDVGERLDALESRMMVVERALKITPPADQVTLAPPASDWQEERVGRIEDALASLIVDVEQIGQTAGKIKELETSFNAGRKTKK